MLVLFDSSSFKVYQKGHQIYFKEQAQILVYLGGIGFILGLLFYGLRLLFLATSAIYLFMNWCSLLIMGASVLLLLFSMIVRIKKPVIIDTDKGLLLQKNKTIAFTGRERFAIMPYLFAGNPHLRIALYAGESVYHITPLLPDKHESELLAIINTIDEKVVVRPAVLPIEKEPQVLHKHFTVWVVCIVGAIWAVTAWYFIPYVAFASVGSQKRILIWPLGLWMMMLGVFQLFGVDIFRMRPAALSRKEKVLILGWALSYYFICSI